MNVTELGQLSDFGTPVLTLGAAIYLWKRLESVTDAYIAAVRETGKVVADNTIATNNYTRSLDSLTQELREVKEVIQKDGK